MLLYIKTFINYLGAKYEALTTVKNVSKSLSESNFKDIESIFNDFRKEVYR